MKNFEPTEEKITLHGLGFLQVQLQANMRLHVWHPELPRRRCFADSSIHDHRFGFNSLVLVGTQINHIYVAAPATSIAATHTAYLHEGPRTQYGNRPWIPDFALTLQETEVQHVLAGDLYEMRPYVYHCTEPGGDGRVATLMMKTSESARGAHSLCKTRVKPDVDFDRKQMSTADMWAFVAEVLGDVALPAMRGGKS